MVRLMLIGVSLFSAVSAAAAGPPLPDLKIEATDGGSVLRVRNGAGQPLTAYLVELVGYPGSDYALYREEIGAALAPGEERRIPIANMTIGAAPEYVKLQAALYADGSSAGTQEKVSQLVGLRRATLETTRGLLKRLENGGSQAVLAAALREWAASIPAPARRERGTAAALEKSTVRELIRSRAAELERGSVANVVASLKAAERTLATSKPAL